MRSSLFSVLLCLGLLVGCQRPQPPVEPSTPQSVESNAAAGNVPTVEKGTLYPTVAIDTSLGVIEVQLNAKRAPITTINFLEYVKDGFYDGTTFHRVVDTMIQGGGYGPDMVEKTAGLRAPIKCESGNGLVNRRGTMGMVRTPGIPNSARAQFYINRDDNFDLESQPDGMGFAVFGKVIRGMEVLAAIGSVPVGTHPAYAGGRSPVVPVTPVVIKSIKPVSPLDWPRARELARIASKSQEELRDRLIHLAEKEGGGHAIKLGSGLIYVDVREGRGAMPTIDDSVEVYYRGTLVDETEIENSLDESKTYAMNNVIEGWKQGLATMKEGGRRILFVPPELAFGSGGIPGKIPGNAWLVFEIELVMVTPSTP